MNNRNCITKNGKPILSLEDWLKLGGPKSPEKQWKAGRSAMETARAWLGHGLYANEMPVEITKYIIDHDDFSEIVSWEAEPEVRLPFDPYRGEPSNTDLAVECTDSNGNFFMGVEAKADETFDKTADKAYLAAINAGKKNERSKATARIEELCQKILNREVQRCPDIYYQLLTATAGVLAETKRRKLKRGILMIHEFVTEETKDKKHEENQSALDTFVGYLNCDEKSIKDGELVGPIYFESADFKGADCSGIAFYIGKARRYLRKVSE